MLSIRFWNERITSGSMSLQKLHAAGYQVTFIGSGQDAADIESVFAIMPSKARENMINLCNQLSLAELAIFLRGADLCGARYDEHTVWPEGFDPQSAGAVRDAGEL